ncbi:uncharacterized protein LOC100376520 [Saccoglossus kowalevskii]|uniref:Aftiphilin-like n=1 Tax=Saccoglossus kowalevskii TaxID=10224 RepID=A0ABM0GQN4_SACKO|nr:PREDICTED: aftiphilin-like [Saccoglossus kowalevskii]
MASDTNFIPPMLSSSPPPLDDGPAFDCDTDDDDDFGGFIKAGLDEDISPQGDNHFKPILDNDIGYYTSPPPVTNDHSDNFSGEEQGFIDYSNGGGVADDVVRSEPLRVGPENKRDSIDSNDSIEKEPRSASQLSSDRKTLNSDSNYYSFSSPDTLSLQSPSDCQIPSTVIPENKKTPQSDENDAEKNDDFGDFRTTDSMEDRTQEDFNSGEGNFEQAEIQDCSSEKPKTNVLQLADSELGEISFTAGNENCQPAFKDTVDDNVSEHKPGEGDKFGHFSEATEFADSKSSSQDDLDLRTDSAPALDTVDNNFSTFKNQSDDEGDFGAFGEITSHTDGSCTSAPVESDEFGAFSDSTVNTNNNNELENGVDVIGDTEKHGDDEGFQAFSEHTPEFPTFKSDDWSADFGEAKPSVSHSASSTGAESEDLVKSKIDESGSNDSDDFGDFGDAKPVDDHQFASFSCPHDDGGDDDFGNFSDVKNTGPNDSDEFGDFDSVKVDKDDFGDFSSSAVHPSTLKDFSVNDDDFGDFSVSTAPTVEHDVTSTTDEFGHFEDSNQTPNASDSSENKLTTSATTLSISGNKLDRVFLACFPRVENVMQTDLVIDLLLDCVNKVKEKQTEAPAQKSKKDRNSRKEEADLNIWNHLKDIEKTHALSYQWTGSNNDKTLMKSLGIDTRNILMSKKTTSSIPIYASNLTLLQPSKIGEKDEKPESEDKEEINKDTVLPQEALPQVEFDWSSSGLINPLDANSLNLDFFATELSSNKKTNTKTRSGLDDELLGLEIDTIPMPPTVKPTAKPFADILSNITTSMVKKPSKRDANLSEEANSILDSLPNLDFMHAKVLMFPIKVSNSSGSLSPV